MRTLAEFNPRVKVLVTGTVLGYLWDCSLATTEVKQFEAKDEREALEIVKERIERNTLTGTGDFTESIGANVCLHIITRIEIEDETFENIRYIHTIIGDLTRNQQSLLDADLC